MRHESNASNTKEHRAWLTSLKAIDDRTLALPPTAQMLAKSGMLSFDQLKLMTKKGAGRNIKLFRRHDLELLHVAEIARTDNGFSILTRTAIMMSDQTTKAAEILDASSDVFQKSLSQFRTTSDEAINEAKKRVSQLNDYSNRISDSLTRLQKTLSDPSMSKALENAAQLATALESLLQLEQSGNLSKVMAALHKQ